MAVSVGHVGRRFKAGLLSVRLGRVCRARRPREACGASLSVRLGRVYRTRWRARCWSLRPPGKDVSIGHGGRHPKKPGRLSALRGRTCLSGTEATRGTGLEVSSVRVQRTVAGMRRICSSTMASNTAAHLFFVGASSMNRRRSEQEQQHRCEFNRTDVEVLQHVASSFRCYYALVVHVCHVLCKSRSRVAAWAFNRPLLY